MRILIIDDSEYKIAELKKYISSDIEIDEAHSYNLGMRKILTNEYDGLFLDMNFPVFENEEVEERKGLFVLKEMKRKKIKIPTVIYSSDMIDVSLYDNISGYIINDNSYIGDEVEEFIEALR